MTYLATRNRVEQYFDQTATDVWARLTSDAPVSGIRATVRAGRDHMRQAFLASLPNDLSQCRILDAGCGTGALSVQLALRGAQVVAVDIAPQLLEIAQKRLPEDLKGHVQFSHADMQQSELGTFDYVVAMDSLIYYTSQDIALALHAISKRVGYSILFSLPPRTLLLQCMWTVGRLFPRADRSPLMVPQHERGLRAAFRAHDFHDWDFQQKERVRSGFYHAQLYGLKRGGLC